MPTAKGTEQGDTWYYDAYSFTATSGHTWRFSTCGVGVGHTINKPCQYAFDRDFQPDGFAAALYIYKAPFYPQVPCQNLVAMCDGVRHCTRIEHEVASSGEYVFVISSDSSVETAGYRRQMKGGAFTATDNADGPYAFTVYTSDPAAGLPPGASLCDSRYSAPSSESDVCTGQVDEDDNATLGLPKLVKYGSILGCRTEWDGRNYNYDAYQFTVDQDSHWLFDLCDSGASRLEMRLLRGAFSPSTPCSVESLVAQNRYYGSCSIWHAGVIDERLSPGLYTLIISNMSRHCDTTEEFEEPYVLKVEASPDAGNFACQAVSMPPIGSACPSQEQGPSLPCDPGREIKYEGKVYRCVTATAAVCGVGDAWSPALYQPYDERTMAELAAPGKRAAYDSNGNLVKDGHRVTQCSICGNCWGGRKAWYCGAESLLRAASRLHVHYPEGYSRGGMFEILPSGVFPAETRKWGDLSSKQSKWWIERYVGWTIVRDDRGGERYTILAGPEDGSTSWMHYIDVDFSDPRCGPACPGGSNGRCTE